MAGQRFEKGSEMWLMFMDFWKLCQAFWIEEIDNDEYWEQLIAHTDHFAKKYKSIPFASKLGVALLEELGHRGKTK